LAGGRPNGVLLLVGPSGIGKTSIAKTVAKVLNRPFFTLSSLSRESLKGSMLHYENAAPGEILTGIIAAKSCAPVILLDEIDKNIGATGVLGAVLELLDPVQNHAYKDDYLGYGFDLSKSIFICTANDVGELPSPLMSRMEMITIPGYSVSEKIHIAFDHIMPSVRTLARLNKSSFDITPEAMEFIIKRYTKEAGVRRLLAVVWRVAQRVARERLENKRRKRALGLSDLEHFLGSPPYDHRLEIYHHGESIGLLYSDDGGEAMIVEAALLSRKSPSDLIITGQAQDVMSESARIAFSYASSRMGLPPCKVHLHVPDGSTPKDGPSAGVAFYAAIASLVLQKTNRAVAMTGEITLIGRVLGVGAVKSKIEGAWEAGIREFIIPKENLPDVQKISRRVRLSSVIHAVETLDEAHRILFAEEVAPPRP
jgi:ATP-dependent Lon protease